MRIRTFALATALCLFVRAGWAASELIGNFVDMPVKTANGAPPAMVEVHNAIVGAASSVPGRPWGTTDSGVGKLIARLQTGRRGHVVVLDVSYDPQRYSISYRNSAHMNYRAADQTIHTSYNVWVRELVEHIDRALGALTPTAAPVGAPAAAAAQVAAVPLAAAPASASAASPAPSAGMPQIGDTWTYRATRIWGRGEIHSGPTVRTHVVRIAAASESEIIDQLTIDGQAPVATTHTRGAYLVTQGLSILSPYLGLWADFSRPISLGTAESRDQGCNTSHVCTARARIVGNERLKTAGGTFSTVRIVVDQSWRSSGSSSPQSASQMNGGRTLTVWYSPELKRAVRYSSRVTVGDVPPIEPQFDLELVSYQLK